MDSTSNSDGDSGSGVTEEVAGVVGVSDGGALLDRESHVAPPTTSNTMAAAATAYAQDGLRERGLLKTIGSTGNEVSTRSWRSSKSTVRTTVSR
jgi:hypothetical protein